MFFGLYGRSVCREIDHAVNSCPLGGAVEARLLEVKAKFSRLSAFVALNCVVATGIFMAVGATQILYDEVVFLGVEAYSFLLVFPPFHLSLLAFLSSQ